MGAPARAAAPGAVVVVEGTRYIPGSSWDANGSHPVDVHIRQGQSLEFVNTDPLAGHSLTSVATTPTPDGAGRPIFDSGSGQVSGFGNASNVDGVEGLKPGSYQFICKVHSWAMQGVLIVDPPVGS
jgi:plastocyanin